MNKIKLTKIDVPKKVELALGDFFLGSFSGNEPKLYQVVAVRSKYAVVRVEDGRILHINEHLSQTLDAYVSVQKVNVSEIVYSV